MLKLDNITKVYETGDLKVEALKGLNLEFRKNEFVSILGPSGCGKTTLLNIIGGLDRYTDGDLIINEKSTKEYKDKDWDTYRNHSIGFVFQSYNLIPHQTVLENVELALTLSGVSKEERRKKATEVLERVGLKDKLKSKPNQLSGGQMQRVAIARALVNDPEIILADEPTGALDSTTSVQIMELLKQISKDKLIIMVTHNPELAEKYSSRIVKLLDGELIDDSQPYTNNKNKKEKTETQHLNKVNKNKKKRMSFFTALSLSFKNLLTKKGRTTLVSFAGSIGIIGIALILAISSGFSGYVNKMQEDTLSTYPITIQAKNIDFSSVITTMFLDTSENASSSHDKDGVYPNDSFADVLTNIGNNLSANDLNKFYQYINENYSEIEDHVNAVQYTYNINLEFYTSNTNPALVQNVQPNSPALLQMIKKYALYYFEKQSYTKVTQNADGTCLIEVTDKTFEEGLNNILNNFAELAPLKAQLQQQGKATLSSTEVLNLVFTIMGINSGNGTGTVMSAFTQMEVFYEMIDNEELIKSQYDLVGENSRFIENSNEALLVLDKNNELDDYVLYSLGLISDEQMDQTLRALVYEEEKNQIKIDYDSILNKEFKVLSQSDYYVNDGAGNIIDFRTLQKTQPALYASYYFNALANCENTVKIVGIVRLNDTTDSGSLATGVAYSTDFTDQMILHHSESLAVTSETIDPISKDNPTSINIYVNTFEAKQVIQDFIEKYNETAENGDEIAYTDFVGIIMSTVSIIINAITYILIAFVGVSLIVSSIMIGIITYISVIERTKEIGVLRSVGASKKDVKRVFTAESFIIGLTSGTLGIVVSILLIIPINVLLSHFTGIVGIASLPVVGAIVLVTVSIVLTLIAGFIPANMAAKKDPVVALRSN